MSNENIIEHEEDPTVTTTETTTKFQQTKTKVAEFVKRNKKNILLTAGSTAMFGLGFVALSALKKDDDSDSYLELDFNSDASDLTVTDPNSGDSWTYVELDSNGSEDGSSDSDVTIVSEETITESTE